MLLFCQCLLTCENSCGVILSCKISGGGGGGLADFFGGGLSPPAQPGYVAV